METALAAEGYVELVAVAVAVLVIENDIEHEEVQAVLEGKAA